MARDRRTGACSTPLALHSFVVSLNCFLLLVIVLWDVLVWFACAFVRLALPFTSGGK